MFISAILTANLKFMNVCGYLLAKGEKFQKLANIIKHQQSLNESVWGVV